MDTLEQFYKKRLADFNAQDPDGGDFDVVFTFGEKKLYAHKIFIESFSGTLEALLSERWTSPNEPIPITSHSYEDFKELVTFLYAGECQLTAENVLSMVDLAEFYIVDPLKSYCEKYLTSKKMEYTSDNVFTFLIEAEKYGLANLKSILQKFIFTYLKIFSTYEEFKELEKSIVEELILSAEKLIPAEDRFEAICRWARHQASKSLGTDQLEAVKENLSSILPTFSFYSVRKEFVKDFIVAEAYSFLFDPVQLRDVFYNPQKEVVVTATDENGSVLKASFVDKFNVYDGIMKLDDDEKASYSDVGYPYWRTKQPIPLTPSEVSTMNDDVEYYLAYDKYGNLAVVPQQKLANNNHYLLAPMFFERRLYSYFGRASRINAEHS